MERATLTLTATLFLFTLSTIQFVAIAEANPIGMFPTNPEPISVLLYSPINGSRCFQEKSELTFTLQIPTLGSVSSLYYTIDERGGGSINGVVIEREGQRFTGFYDRVKYSATLNLSGLSDGWHTLTINVAGVSPYNPTPGGMGSIDAYVYDSASIQFLFDIAPINVSVLSPKNATYVAGDVPLIFTLSEQADWISFSLDGQANTTIDGNTTLTRLPDGYHSLIVYANDTVGRLGISETIHFATEEKEKTATAQNEPAPSPIQPVAASIFTVAVAGAGFLVYFKKRKPEVEHS